MKIWIVYVSVHSVQCAVHVVCDWGINICADAHNILSLHLFFLFLNNNFWIAYYCNRKVSRSRIQNNDIIHSYWPNRIRFYGHFWKLPAFYWWISKQKKCEYFHPEYTWTKTVKTFLMSLWGHAHRIPNSSTLPQPDWICKVFFQKSNYHVHH